MAKPLQANYGIRKGGITGKIASNHPHYALRLKTKLGDIVDGHPVNVVNNLIVKGTTTSQVNKGVVISQDNDFKNTELAINGDMVRTYDAGEYVSVMTSGFIYVAMADTSTVSIGETVEFNATTNLWQAESGAATKVEKFAVDDIVDSNIIKMRIHDVKGAQYE